MKRLLNLIGFSVYFFLLTLSLYISSGICQEEIPLAERELIDKINQAFQKAGIFEGYVQYDEKTKMFEIKGKFRNYDEFLYAYMIAQVFAGVSKVSPAYSIKHAVIIHTPIELCLPYAILGKECPHHKRKVGEEPLERIQTSTQIKGNKYALVIGVSQFVNIDNGVPGADNDAIMWGKYLESRGFEVTYLINENATKEKVRSAIRDIVSRLVDGDTFILLAASHGTPKNVDGEVGIVLYDSIGELNKKGKGCGYYPPSEPHLQAANKMCALVKDSLSIREDVLSYLKNKKVVFIPILDACYSGDALRGYLGDVVKSEVVAPLDFYEKRLKEMAPQSLYMVLASASGFRQAFGYDPRNFREIRSVFKRGLEELPLQRKVEQKEQSSSIDQGIFSFYFVNGLIFNEHSIAKTYEATKDAINRESEFVCNLLDKGGSNLENRGVRSIRVVTTTECPKGGQNPVLLKIRGEDFRF